MYGSSMHKAVNAEAGVERCNLIRIAQPDTQDNLVLVLLSSCGHWHLVRMHWLPRCRRARPSTALDVRTIVIKSSAAPSNNSR